MPESHSQRVERAASYAAELRAIWERDTWFKTSAGRRDLEEYVRERLQSHGLGDVSDSVVSKLFRD